ncbi:RrF2 family transcriptional regulator [Gemmatimonadota bacterium]
MLTRTTETALMALIYLVGQGEKVRISPREVAARIGVSASYLAKIFTDLVKAEILTSLRGAHGGVTLARDPSTITLLEVAGTFQAPLAEDPLWAGEEGGGPCEYNQAVSRLQEQIHEVLSQWSLRDLAADPCPVWMDPRADRCRMTAICPKHKTALESGKNDIAGSELQ